MDVTPRELRDVEIREAFRGYNRDEVNDLLERAASAIEALNERTRVLTERLSTQGSEPARGRESEDIEQMLHRTLLLAQRASDEAIAEAEEKARAMLEDAETRSRTMLADAAIEARRTTETERRRLEQEITDLKAQRDALSTDVDGLEHFETDYRTRLMSAMEADLHAIERDLQAIRERAEASPGEKPVVSDVAGGSGSDATDDASTREVDVRGFFDEKSRPLIGSGGGVTPDATSSDVASSAAAPHAEGEMVDANAAEGASTDVPQAASGDKATQSSSTIDLFGEEQAAVESAALDDDSFFASLRDAVRDDAPLGPRDASERAFFDQDDSKDSPNFREAFKRRR